MIGSIIMWLVVGFIAGLIAKAIVPGRQAKPSGFWGTALLGIVGAIVGGAIYYLVSGGNSGFRTHFDLPSIFWATLGAIVVVAIERAVAGRRQV